MLHQAAQAALVAPHAAAHLGGTAAEHLVGPVGVGDELAAHGGAVDAAFGQLPLHEVRVGQPAHAAHRQAGVLPHHVAQEQKAAFLPKVRVVRRRDGVRQGAVVRQRHMKAGHARGLQHRHGHRQLVGQKARPAVVFQPHHQLEVDGQVRLAGPHRLHCLPGKAQAVFQAAAVSVGAPVEQGGGEAAAHPVAVHLHQVEARPAGLGGRVAEGGGDALHLFGGQAGDVGTGRVVQLLPQLVRADAPGQQGGQVFHHRPQVRIRLMQLRPREASLAVQRAGEPPVVLKPFFRKQAAEALSAYRHVAHPGQSAAPGGDAPQQFLLLRFRKAQGGGGEHDAVFQPQASQLQRPPDGFIHGAGPPGPGSACAAGRTGSAAPLR